MRSGMGLDAVGGASTCVAPKARPEPTRSRVLPVTREEVSLLREAYGHAAACARARLARTPSRPSGTARSVRTVGFGSQGWVEYRELAGLEGPALDTLIARQVRFFAERGERFEWKYHGHDLPADLPERLRAAGFVPEETETVDRPGRNRRRRAEVAGGSGDPRSARAGRRIARLEASVWGGSTTGRVDDLAAERAADPEGLRLFLAEAGTSRSAPAGPAFLPARSS